MALNWSMSPLGTLGLVGVTAIEHWDLTTN